MAKGVFTFRLTSEGVDELKAKLEALGPSGQKAFEQLRQMSPQLADAMKVAAKSADTARASLEQLPKSGAGLSDTFGRAEGAVKSFGRATNDLIGAANLLVPGAAAANAEFALMSRTVGNLSDVFGVLQNATRANWLGPVTAAVTLAGGAFLAWKGYIDDANNALKRIQPTLDAVQKQIDATKQKTLETRGGIVVQADDQIGALVLQREVLQRDAEAKRAAALEREQKFREENPLSVRREPRISRGDQAALDDVGKQISAIDEKLKALRESREALRRAEAESVDEFAGRGESLAAIKLEQRQKAIEEQKRREEEAQRAAERAQAELERSNKEIAALEARKAEQVDKQNQAVDKYLAKLEEEARLVGMTNEQREVGRALYEAQAKLVDELGQKTRDLTDAERERITAAVKTREAMEAQAKAAEKLKAEMERAAQRSTDRLVDFAGDALFDRLSGKASNFWETFKTYGMRTISQLAAEMVFRPIVAPLVGAAVSAAPGLFGAGGGASAATAAGGGGLGGLVSSPISSLLSTGGSLLSSAFGGSGGILQSVGGFVGSALGLGGGSAALGAFSAGAFGATAGATGAAAAAAAGSSLAAGGISGAAAGSTAALAGGAAALSPLAATGIGALIAIPALFALSGLFGKKKNVGPFASYAAHLMPDGSLEYKGGGEKNGGSMAQMQEATAALADAIKQVSGALGIYKLPTLAVGVGSNKARGTFFGDGGSEEAAVYFGQDVGIAGAAYVRAALQGRFSTGSRIDQSTEAARIFARTTGDAKTDLEFVAVYESLDKSAAAAANVARTLGELNSKFDDYAKLAERYGLEVERIEKARQEAIENVTTELVKPLTDRLAGVRGLIASLQVGAGSPLSAEKQLGAARGQFDSLASRAAGGDEAAQSALGDAGRAYLDTARGFFGTTETYAGIYSDVLGRLGDIVRSVRESDPTVRAIVETGERGTAAVSKLLDALIDEVQQLRGEVRRGNDVPFRVSA